MAVEDAIPNLTDQEKLRFVELWHSFTDTQRKLVIAIPKFATKKEAAESIGIEASSAYTYNGIISEAVSLIRKDRELAALTILGMALPEAAMTKYEGLQSGNEHIRQNAATEILDRHLGKPGASVDVTVNNQVLIFLKQYHEMA